MDDFTNMIKEMNKDLDERRRLFDSIQPLYMDLILLSIGPDCSDEVFLRAAGIERI
ncbi:hypothetical protein LCGC14_2421680 [marine sediment metagenome]|uniref:Uncharacterized protein n=1 Tax=marine sediment metagenome TaxID=412755 RepID=A0A0F9BPI5_9ZZZZ